MKMILTIIGLFLLSGAISPTPNNDRPYGLPWDKSLAPFVLTDGFFARRGKNYHEAWDCAMIVGTPVKANFNAQVEMNWSPKAGRYISLKNGPWEVLVMHLSKFELKNLDHGFVKFGDVIGYSGVSGETTGPHLHWSVSYRGIKINPQDIMAEQ